MTGRGRKTERKVEPITATSSSDSDDSMTQRPIKYAEPITATNSSDSDSSSMTQRPIKYAEPIPATNSSDSSPMTQGPIKYAEPVAGPSGLCGFKRTANSGGAGGKKPKMVPTPSTSSESDSETFHGSPLGGINWALSKRRRDTDRLQRAPSRRRRQPARVPKTSDHLHSRPQIPQKKKCGAQAADPELINSIHLLSQIEQVMFLAEKIVNIIGYLHRLTLTKELEALRKAQRSAKKAKKHRRRWEETLEEEEEDGLRAPDLKEDAEDETSSDSQRWKTFQESLVDYRREQRKGNGEFESDSDSD